MKKEKEKIVLIVCSGCDILYLSGQSVTVLTVANYLHCMYFFGCLYLPCICLELSNWAGVASALGTIYVGYCFLFEVNGIHCTCTNLQYLHNHIEQFD